MALTDIVFTEGESENILLNIGTVMTGNIEEILSDIYFYDTYEYDLILQISSSGITCFAY